ECLARDVTDQAAMIRPPRQDAGLPDTPGKSGTPTRLDTLPRISATAQPTRRSHWSAFPYKPSVDGIRAIAVIAVLLYHNGFTWAEGGFLGVSLFFTLSGYLITRLLLAEYAATHHIGLLAFWARRLRRLAPAAVLTLVGV